MKKEFSTKPDTVTSLWPGELDLFSWKEFVAAIPAAVFLVTSYKANGKENACLQSWSSFVGYGGRFICILGAVNKGGHMYQSIKETGCCVLNFPSKEIYDRCFQTIENNHYDCDEITVSGLTAEKAVSVQAPRVAECFLNIECTYLWEHELYPGSQQVAVALEAKHLCMDSEHYDESKSGRYGKSGYLYYNNSPRNPDTGEAYPDGCGTLEFDR